MKGVTTNQCVNQAAVSFPRFSGHYLKGGYDVQNADQISG